MSHCHLHKNFYKVSVASGTMKKDLLRFWKYLP